MRVCDRCVVPNVDVHVCQTFLLFASLGAGQSETRLWSLKQLTNHTTDDRDRLLNESEPAGLVPIFLLYFVGHTPHERRTRNASSHSFAGLCILHATEPGVTHLGHETGRLQRRACCRLEARCRITMPSEMR
ncbi:unnamed protein product [Protopolystoma xenopodis]|uniref:Uncharacterized protein n=1 Tax=Protopolystoma xenopodis TaxID=117903 RepID=A0A448XIM2_9PLAT|nr:unnamed protein product [Protopolystoma xenopodis]